MKTWLFFLLKLLLTAGCLAWAFSGIDVRSTILSRPEELGVGWLAAGLMLAGGAVVFGAFRWQVFLAAQDIHVSFGRVLEMTLIGNLFSLVSVGSLGGDAARVLLLARHVPAKKAELAASVMIDHMSGMVAMALMFFLFTAGRFEAIEQQSALGKGILHFTWVYFVGGMLAIVVGFVVMSPLIHGRVHRDGRWVRWEFMRTFPEACDRYRKKWKHMVAGVGVSCLIMVCYYLAFWAGARAVGCEVGSGPFVAAMPVIDGLSAIPVSVSGLGVREKLFEVLLADLAGVSKVVAVSASLTGFLLHVCWALVGGVLFLLHKGDVTVREIRESHV